MNHEEVIQKLNEYCRAQENSGILKLLTTETIRFEKTKLLKQYLKTANIPRPSSIQVSPTLEISKHGLHYKSKLHEWRNVAETLIKTQTAPSKNDHLPDKHEYYFVFAFDDGSIFEAPINNFESFYGQFGHFIEEFKQGI